MTNSLRIVGDAGAEATHVTFGVHLPQATGFYFFPSGGAVSSPNLTGFSIHSVGGAVRAYVPPSGTSELRVEHVHADTVLGAIAMTRNFGTLRLELIRCHFLGATAWRVFGVAPLEEPLRLEVPLRAMALGETWSAQPWIRSSVAPHGAAFGNVVSFVIGTP